MTLQSVTVLRLSDFGIWVQMGFIHDQLLINADITLRRQRRWHADTACCDQFLAPPHSPARQQ
jgi:hypothetical protein